MAQDVQTTVVPPDFEIAMVSARPAIEHLHDFNAMIADKEAARHRLASVIRNALHAHNQPRIRIHTRFRPHVLPGMHGDGSDGNHTFGRAALCLRYCCA